MMFALENQPAIDFIRQDKDIAIANDFGNLLEIAFGQDSTCGIVWRIQDNQLRAGADKASKLVPIQGEVSFFLQANRHSASANIMNHGLINWKAGTRIDDLVA